MKTLFERDRGKETRGQKAAVGESRSAPLEHGVYAENY